MTDVAATVDAQLRAAAADSGDRPAILFGDDSWTFADLDALTARAANGLASQGIGPGEHVAIFMANRPEFLVAWLGAARSGPITVAVNAGLKGDGLAYVLDHSDAVAVIVEAALTDELDDVLESLPNIRTVVVVDPTDRPDSVTWDDLLDASAEAPDSAIGPNDPMMLMYTSGTTGRPKAVVIAQGRCVGPSMLLMAAGITDEDIAFTSLPFFHASGALVSFWGSFGLRIPLGISRRFSASRHWSEMAHYGATFFNALGAIIPILMKAEPAPDDAANSCRVVISAGCPVELWRPFEKRFGVSIFEWYGTVEGGITIAGPDAPIGSIGKPVGMEARVVREDDSETDTGEVGELIFRPLDGPAEIAYYKNAEAAAAKTDGGWLRTGDRVHRDADGFLFYVDRGSHFIRRRGENISAIEIETVINAHPDIIECAAYGLPSPLGEDDVAVALVRRPGTTVSEEDVVEYCSDRMASFQVPRYIRFTEAMPKTGTQKIQKTVLRDEGLVTDIYDREGPSSPS